MILGFALKVSIMLTLFGFGLQATPEDFLYLLRRPGVLVRSLVAMFVVMPVFAILMTRFASFDRAVIIALIVLSISPVRPILPTKVTKSGGHPPYGLGLKRWYGRRALPVRAGRLRSAQDLWIVGAMRAMIAAPDLTWLADLNRFQAAAFAVGVGDRVVRRHVGARWRDLARQRAPGRLLYLLASFDTPTVA